MTRIAFAILSCALVCGTVAGRARPQTSKTSSAANAALTNQDVLSMLKAGLPADIVAAKIKASPCRFNTSPAELEKLKAASVPDSVILAMVKASANPTKESPAKDAALNPSPIGREKDGKPRVYVSNSQSWLMHGGFGASGGSAGGASRGGSSPQTVEVIKTFGQRCPQVIVTENRDRAAFVVLFDRESFKGFIRKRDKIAVFRRNGDALFTNSVRSVGSAVKNACRAILKASMGKKEN